MANPQHTANIELHPAQCRIWAERAQRNVICCGRRFGKTVLAGALALDTLTQGLPVLYTAPTYTDLEERYVDFERFLRPLLRRSETKFGRITLTNGAVLTMQGIYRYDGIRSNRFGRVIIDEAAHSQYLSDAWNNAIRATLTDYRGDAYFISTPRGNNYFRELYRRAGTDGWAAWQLPTSANPYIASAEIETAQKELPALIFRQEYLAEFIEQEGTLVKRENIQYCDRVPDGAVIVFGVDLAFSTKKTADYTAIIALSKHNGKTYIIDAWRGRGTLEELTAALIKMAEKHNPVRIAVEDVGGQKWFGQEITRKTNLPIKLVKPTGDKVQRFYPLLAQYEQYNVFHLRGLPVYFERELLSFTGTAQDDHDDMIDAASYAFSMKFNTQGIYSL